MFGARALLGDFVCKYILARVYYMWHGNNVFKQCASNILGNEPAVPRALSGNAAPDCAARCDVVIDARRRVRDVQYKLKSMKSL